MDESSDSSFLQNKKKRKRTAPDQLKVLEETFATHQHPNLTLRNQLASQLNMTPRSVQIWFQNRRAKSRNSSEFSPTHGTASNGVLAITNTASIPTPPQAGSPTTASALLAIAAAAPAPTPLSHSGASLLGNGASPPSPSLFSPPEPGVSSIDESVYKSIYLTAINKGQTPGDDESEELHMFWLKFLQSQNAPSESQSSQQNAQPQSQDPPVVNSTAPAQLLDANGNAVPIVVPVPAAQVPKFHVNDRDSKGLTLLFMAVVLGYEQQVKRLIEAGADINIIDNSGNSPLAAASVLGHTSIVRYLLQNRADCNLCNTQGHTPLYLACKGGYADVVKMLLEHGAEVDMRTEEGDTCLHIAALKGLDDVCKILLSHGATVDVYDRNRFAPLHHASVKGHLTIVNLLLTARADVNAKDSKQHVPLHAAALMGYEQVVNSLIDHRAAVDAQDSDGYTPLHYAVREGRDGVVKCLIRAGADLEKKSYSKMGIIHIAARWSSVQMCKLLIDAGCKSIDDETLSGLRPVHFAALTGKMNFMKFLLEKGAAPLVNDLLLNADEANKQASEAAYQNGNNIAAGHGDLAGLPALNTLAAIAKDSKHSSETDTSVEDSEDMNAK